MRKITHIAQMISCNKILVVRQKNVGILMRETHFQEVYTVGTHDLKRYQGDFLHPFMEFVHLNAI